VKNTKWPQRDAISGEFYGLANQVDEFNQNLLTLWSDGGYTMKWIESSYANFRERIRQAAAANITETQFRFYRQKMLQTIDQQLVKLETAASVSQVLGTEAWNQVIFVYQLIKNQQAALTDDKNDVRLSQTWVEVLHGAFGVVTLSQIQLETIERDLNLANHSFSMLEFVAKEVNGLRAVLVLFRNNVKNSRFAHNNALWSDKSAVELEKILDENLMSLQDELDLKKKKQISS